MKDRTVLRGASGTHKGRGLDFVKKCLEINEQNQKVT